MFDSGEAKKETDAGRYTVIGRQWMSGVESQPASHGEVRDRGGKAD